MIDHVRHVLLQMPASVRVVSPTSLQLLYTLSSVRTFVKISTKMDKKAYLAEKYMSGPKADAILARTTHKKKKRKVDSAATSTLSYKLVDDDGGWGNEMQDDGDDIEEAVVEKDRTFKKKAANGGSGWATVREGDGRLESPPPPEDEKPQVVDEQSMTPIMGGLVTASQFKKSLPKKEKQKAETEEEREAARLAQETVYRDATGRKIDTKAEKAEAARKKREREEREAKKMEWGKGLVQREDEEKKRAQLERERIRDLAVYADDKELNEEQKARERWNDPAAAFLTVSFSEFLHPFLSRLMITHAILTSLSQKKRLKGPRKPQYTGPPPPPNRFGIKPGYRWDGVGA